MRRFEVIIDVSWRLHKPNTYISAFPSHLLFQSYLLRSRKPALHAANPSKFWSIPRCLGYSITIRSLLFIHITTSSIASSSKTLQILKSSHFHPCLYNDDWQATREDSTAKLGGHENIECKPHSTCTSAHRIFVLPLHICQPLPTPNESTIRTIPIPS